jgi:hypothetical protein
VAKTANPHATPTTANRPIGPRVAITNPLSFDGPAVESGITPPDTQGDVGPSQFFITLNTRFRTFTKTGVADGVINVTPDAFFAPAETPISGSVTCNFTSDPHVRFDPISQRWFIVMIDVPNCTGDLPNRIMIARSDTATITGSTVWTFFHIDAPATLFADYPTLGIDNNALYIGVNNFSTSTSGYIRSDGYVVQKSSILGAGPIVSTRFTLTSSVGPFTPQGVDDPYNVDAHGYFVGVDVAVFSRLDVVTVTDPGGSPTVSNAQLNVSATNVPVTVPHLGNTGGTNGNLDALDDRLFAATMTADGHIWTAHNIGMNAAGGVTNPTRNGSRWYELNPGTPSVVQSGTVVDSSATNAVSFWIPTVAVNGQGVMVIGGSASSTLTHADAWFSGRLPSDTAGSTDVPTRYTATGASYNPAFDTGGSSGRRWGDYSLTRVDPNDNQTIWTIQEYVNATNSWGVRVAKLLAPGPASPTSASTSVPIGRASTHVTITGTSSAGSGWYDPGASFAQRFQAAVGCGVTVNSATVNSPTQVTLDLNTTAATAGSCDVTTTNPDGQFTTTAGLLELATFRSDALVKVASAASFVGDNVYNTTGSGQSVTASKPQGTTQQFTIRVQNDGTSNDSFKLSGPGNQSGFTAHYFDGTTDITSAVVAGTFQTVSLAPGGTKDYRLAVSVSSTATIGVTRSWLVRATSVHDNTNADAVKSAVKVVKYRPDAMIKLASATSFVGDNIFNLTGTNQTVTINKKRGTSQSFSYRVQNDGTVADTFRLVGPGNKTGFTVHYFAGTTNITSNVVAGTFVTGSLAPGAAVTFRIVVTVASTATIGSTPSWLVKATSTHQTTKADAAKAQVHVLAS